jgi:glycosyltransferase involved in cell wall biosynthesis
MACKSERPPSTDSAPQWRVLASFPTESVGVWRIHLEPEDEPIAPYPLRTLAAGDLGRPLLSAAMIVRNEEHCLRACLGSIRDLVDEIVVVDTGSRDRTIEIAREFGARVFEFPWCDDFSAARNYALERVQGEWVLQIDADEVARPFDRDEIHRRLRDPLVGGYYVRFQRRRMLTPNWQLKLFRRHPKLRYRGVIHENLEPTMIRRVIRLSLGECPLEIDHFGYDGDLSAKHARNLPLLLRRLERSPDAPEAAFLWRHASDIYAALGDDSRAEETGLRALDVLRAKRRLHPVDVAVYLGLIEHQLKLRRDVHVLLREAAALFLDDLHLIWLQGLTLMAARRRSEALAHFEGLLERGGTADTCGWVGYDRRILGDYARQCRALCAA